jgi:transposase-like protein
MIACPHCQRTDQQVKVGRNASGSQRYLCKACQRKYTPEPKVQGYPEETRRQVLEHYVDGMNMRRIGRAVGVSRQTVSNWVNAHANTLPNTPLPPEPVEVSELDELFTFVGSKKTRSTSSPKSTGTRIASSDGT